MWRTFEIQILGWEEPEVVAEGGQFKQKSKLLLQNMLIIGGRANHHGLSDGDIIKKKSAKYGVLVRRSFLLRSNQFFASECILSSLQKMFVCHL